MSNNKTFRLFISSTFSDFKKEREVLHTQVFPEVERYCQDNGFVFQPIDLRWGVSNEAQLDQKTLELCLEEVRVCKHFPHPNFLIMAGDRYGYIPLPYMIEKDEFEKISNLVKIVDDLELLNFWYKLDKNQIPASYILQPRKNHTQNSDVNDKFKKDFVTLNAPVDEEKKEFNAAWSEHENRLRTILQNAANEIFKNKNDKEYQKYFLSATEQEVIEGIYDYHNLTSHKVDVKYIFGYFKGQQPDIKGDDALKFKANLKSILTPENFVEEIESLTKKLRDAIYDQITTFEKMTELDKELSEQLSFRNTKAENFIGREKTLKKISKYRQNSQTTMPLIIHGASGMGKSSLMAKAISEALSEDKNIFYRFVGATTNSTTIRSTLISLCDELQEKSIIENIAEYEVEDYQFFMQIQRILASIKTPVVIFVDALDQLLYKDYLEWLPQDLQNNLKIVLSVLNDKKYEEDTHYFKVLKQRYDNQEFFIDLKEDSLESNKEQLIEKLLKSENRRLDNAQKEYLLEQWKNTNYSPLYLKIAIEEVKHWRAGDNQTLASDVQGIIAEYLQNLTTLYHHDKILVDKVLGYIYASKDGLSEKELLEILSEDLEDEKEFQDEIVNQFHEPIKKQNPRRDNKEELVLPLSLWSRLYSQLKPFIIERNIDKQPLMKFFHRQFTTVVEKKCIKNKKELHLRFTRYFFSVQNLFFLDNNLNFRVHSEYPYHLLCSSNYKKLLILLLDFKLWSLSFESSREELNYEILQDIIKKETEFNKLFIETLGFFYKVSEHIKRLNEVTKILDEKKFKFSKNLSKLNIIYAYALGILNNSILKRYVLENKNKYNLYQIAPEMLWRHKTVDFPVNKINTHIFDINNNEIIVFDKKSEKYVYQIQTSKKKHIKFGIDYFEVWDSEKKICLKKLYFSENIEKCFIIQNEKYLVYTKKDTEETVYIYEYDGLPNFNEDLHFSKINKMQFLNNGNIITSAYDSKVCIWDKENGNLVETINVKKSVEKFLESSNEQYLVFQLSGSGYDMMAYNLKTKDKKYFQIYERARDFLILSNNTFVVAHKTLYYEIINLDNLYNLELYQEGGLPPSNVINYFGRAREMIDLGKELFCIRTPYAIYFINYNGIENFSIRLLYPDNFDDKKCGMIKFNENLIIIWSFDAIQIVDFVLEQVNKFELNNEIAKIFKVNNSIMAILTEDSNVYFYSLDGRKIFQPLNFIWKVINIFLLNSQSLCIIDSNYICYLVSLKDGQIIDSFLFPVETKHYNDNNTNLFKNDLLVWIDKIYISYMKIDATQIYLRDTEQ